MGMTGWLGMKGARCAFTPIGPMPGPPPPCGMQNVLCRFKWQTSAPMWPGDVRPTCSSHAQQLSCHSRDQEPHSVPCNLTRAAAAGQPAAAQCAGQLSNVRAQRRRRTQDANQHTLHRAERC